MRPITCLVIHHSASPSGSVAQFRAEHKARGWSDIGYHTVIGNGHGMPDGSVQQGRPDAIKGSAVFGANTGKLHVCLVGDFTQSAPTPRQLQALGEWLLHRAIKYRCSVVRGHKEAAIAGHGTLCPGNLPLDKIRRWLDRELPHYCFHGEPYDTLAQYLAFHNWEVPC